ncbi:MULTISPECIES: GUN4 domain-containing protein [unclassified Nodosilinea]|uniref:GUN4 domain-containing protein n=1 Tax=Leptolyngbya subtilissima DQ-A4 TaxID=2933933 RepID=A0ABV0K656_9CYAN|nr:MULTISPECIES: GUN4 domain-containing protein [unclassified Nodosilinea]MBD2107842.1 GUN4 domain-containing protein [Nodosilinea sp. FACHB-13]MBD2114536.1 GUN4 domain-containing protein [Nodosilinea sp. FACHB-141]
MDEEGSQAELAARIEALEARVEGFIQQGITERIARMEDALTLVTDVERYQPLQRLLKTGKLREADEETVRVILQEAGTPDREDLTPDAVRLFSCSVLRVVDRLWTTYTGGRFGFSVQLQIYQSVGGTLESALIQDTAILNRLGEQVGWRQDDQWKTIDQARHDLDDPVGCYPIVWWNSPYGAKMVNYFLSRLFTCQL